MIKNSKAGVLGGLGQEPPAQAWNLIDLINLRSSKLIN
jgi:hypothetical protein